MKKVLVITMIIMFSCIVYSQSNEIVLEDQLRAEIQQLKEVNKKLQAEYDSLHSIYRSSGENMRYYVRMDGNHISSKLENRIIGMNIVGNKYVYSIQSFSNPHDAYRMAQDLRALKPKDFSIVQKESNLRHLYCLKIIP